MFTGYAAPKGTDVDGDRVELEQCRFFRFGDSEPITFTSVVAASLKCVASLLPSAHAV